MIAFSSTLALICLLTITYQDFSSRSVHWIFFPLLALAGILHSLTGLHSLQLLMTFAGYNLAFLTIQWALLAAYFRLRGMSPKTMLDQQLGLGDILFLGAACFFFSPGNFILFYIYSLVGSLVFALPKLIRKKSLTWPIPLAGLQALFLLLTYGTGMFLKYSLLSDQLLMNKITGM